jgi:hypothetical protein
MCSSTDMGIVSPINWNAMLFICIKKSMSYEKYLQKKKFKM